MADCGIAEHKGESYSLREKKSGLFSAKKE